TVQLRVEVAREDRRVEADERLVEVARLAAVRQVDVLAQFGQVLEDGGGVDLQFVLDDDGVRREAHDNRAVVAALGDRVRGGGGGQGGQGQEAEKDGAAGRRALSTEYRVPSTESQARPPRHDPMPPGHFRGLQWLSAISA